MSGAERKPNRDLEPISPVPSDSAEDREERSTFWVHQAGFTFRRDEPDKVIETIWTTHPGWGHIKRRDMWIKVRSSAKELVARGFIPMKPSSHADVRSCPNCGLHMDSVPGHLVHKHISQCGNSGDDRRKMEEAVVSERRLKQHEAKILAAIIREREEQEALEKKERFDRIKEENLAKQQHKDRKKRLKEQTKKELHDRYKDK